MVTDPTKHRNRNWSSATGWKKAGFILPSAFLFLKVFCFPIMSDSCFWGVLQSFAISKLLQINVLTFLFVSNSALASAMNITLGHKHKEPLGATWIWRVQVNGPVPFRSSSTQTKGQIHDKSRCVWCKEDEKYES